MGRKKRNLNNDEMKHDITVRKRSCNKINSTNKHVNASIQVNYPFSIEEVNEFITKGYILLQNAFPRDVAYECQKILWDRLAIDGILENDKSTWVERHGIPESYTTEDHPIWNKVLTDRLKNAIDQLCGPNRWKKFGCGWWIITFPGEEFALPPWEAAGKWHVDGASYQHHIDSRESGLVAIFLFSDIAKTEGGTALSVGSHYDVAKTLDKYEPRGLKGGALSRTIQPCLKDKEVVEVNGKAGDIMLLHPFLVHARSKNLGKNGKHSVRFMCNPNIELHERMEIFRYDEDYSPVERAIREALLQVS